MEHEDDEGGDEELPQTESQAPSTKYTAGKPRGKKQEDPTKQEKKVEKKVYGPPPVRQKNDRGDYVVTKITIKDRAEELKKV